MALVDLKPLRTVMSCGEVEVRWPKASVTVGGWRAEKLCARNSEEQEFLCGVEEVAG